MSNLLNDVRLSLLEGVGSLTVQRLLERFGSATGVFEATYNELRGTGHLDSAVIDTILVARQSSLAEDVIHFCERENIQILHFRDETYPPMLKEIYDPPPILYLRGTILPSDVFAVAVVGTRNISSYGRRMTERITRELVQAGCTIVSGLAVGVDGTAHETALKNGGRTIAVLGSGICNVYPPQHRHLAADISLSGRGAVLSEYPPLQHCTKNTFPQRNRIVSGMTLGTLVVEAPIRSGAMITARLAAEQGREVFATAGPSDQHNSHGCHQLIKDGAVLTESAADILEIVQALQRIRLCQFSFDEGTHITNG